MNKLSLFIYYSAYFSCISSLNTLNICLSHVGTLEVVDALCIDYDSAVQQWSDSLKLYMENQEVRKSNVYLTEKYGIKRYISCLNVLI